MNLLKACKGNLEMAINVHYSKQEIMPELAKAVNNVAMETSPGDPASAETSSASDVSNENEGINQSILSLLVKLKTSMASSCSSSPERLVIKQEFMFSGINMFWSRLVLAC